MSESIAAAALNVRTAWPMNICWSSARRARRRARPSAASPASSTAPTSNTSSAASPSRARSSAPVDFRRLKEGFVETDTAGMLPEADIAFLDEVFQGSTAILNTLLGSLNERTFRRGHTSLQCPLRICVGASNALPADDALAAFADRFLLRAYVQPVSDSRIEELLEGGWLLAQSALEVKASVADLDALVAASRAADLDAARPLLSHPLREVRRHGVGLSDRRAVKKFGRGPSGWLRAATTHPRDSLWHNPDFPAPVVELRRESSQLHVLGMGMDEETLEHWTHELPSLTLRARDTRDAPPRLGPWSVEKTVDDDGAHVVISDTAVRARIVLRGARSVRTRLQPGALAIGDDRGRAIIFDLVHGAVRRDVRV